MQLRRHPNANMLALVARIQPQAGEMNKAQSHRRTVRRRLTTSFDLRAFLPIGSHARNTAVRWYSDVDVLALLRRNEAKWGGDIIRSSTFLRKVRDDLEDRYVWTNVRGDQQAVVIEFGGGQHRLDVVPAIFDRFDRGRPIYLIPNGSDGWLETSPQAHSRYLATALQKSGGKLSKVIQLLKWWKFSRSTPIPIQSFYLDMLMAYSGVCTGVKSYSQCLFSAFKVLADRECRGLRDPLGIAGVLQAAATDRQREEVNKAVEFALLHAANALVAERKKDFPEANRQWNIVFNGQY